jgi:hypothetical protein
LEWATRPTESSSILWPGQRLPFFWHELEVPMHSINVG